MEDSVSNFISNLFLRKHLTHEHDQFSNGPGVSIPCGSDSEFYILPPLCCISDSDILKCLTVDMAFSGHKIILPDDLRCFGERIECVRIEPYKNYPGFVRLIVVGNMIYDWVSERYNFVEIEKPYYVSGNIFRQQLTNQLKDPIGGQICGKFTGPALKKIVQHHVLDDVHCLCCPRWPLEAREWPVRKRKGDWPRPVMILEVVRHGCHVVWAQHRDCRDDDLQFRLSFSLAEVMLLRTWTPTQQLVFHMLRFFAKKELIQADCPQAKKCLCTYHLKTLMLWTCEEESAEWWKSSSVVAICCRLLRKLLEWVEKRECRNYFIPEANLFSGKIDPAVAKCVTYKLKLICDVANLSQWFVNNYLLRCYKSLNRGRAQREVGKIEIDRLYITFLRNKSQYQLQLFDDRFTAIICDNMTGIWEFHEVMIDDKIKVCAHMDKNESMWVRRNLVLRSEKPFVYLDSALLLIYAANVLTCQRMLNCNDFVSDIISIVSIGTSASIDWRRYHNYPNTYRDRIQKSLSCLLKAEEHMGKLCRPRNDPQFQLMSRLSVHYLRKSFDHKDLATSVIRPSTMLYMAALCFADSQFEVAFDFCSTIIHNIVPAIESKIPRRQEKPLNAGSLIFIDDVSNCVGFSWLFRFINNILRRDPRQNVLNLRLSPHVFAEYLMRQCAERMSKELRMNWIQAEPVFRIDYLLKQTVKRKLRNIGRSSSRLCVYRRNDKVVELLNRVTGFSLDEDTSVRLLMECSLQSISSLYQMISDHYGVQCHTVVCCYRALYCFKRLQYDNVLRICDQILGDPELEDHLYKLSRPQTIFLDKGQNWFAFPHVLVLRPFNVYFDDDLQGLIGIQILCHLRDPLRAAKGNQKITLDLRVEERHGARNQTDMNFHHLLSRKGFMFQYFLGRHFLARYLKIRCFLLRDASTVSEIFQAFGDLKPQLPFEHVVQKFLRQKLQKKFHDWHLIVLTPEQSTLFSV